VPRVPSSQRHVKSSDARGRGTHRPARCGDEGNLTDSTSWCATVLLLCLIAFPFLIQSSERCRQVRHQKPVKLLWVGQLISPAAVGGGVPGSVPPVLHCSTSVTASRRQSPTASKGMLFFSVNILCYSIFYVLLSYRVWSWTCFPWDGATSSPSDRCGSSGRAGTMCWGSRLLPGPALSGVRNRDLPGIYK